jgi:prephenate dehydratase
MHSLIYHLIKHLLRGLVIVAQHLVHHAPAAHTAVRHAAAAHTVAAHTLAGTQAAGGLSTAMPAAHVGTVPLNSTAAALHAQNVRSSIMASVGQEQAAAIPDVGDFSLFSS